MSEEIRIEEGKDQAKEEEGEEEEEEEEEDERIKPIHKSSSFPLH